MNQPPRGFSLIEVLVTVGIVAVVIALTLPVIGSIRGSSLDTRCLVEMRDLARRVEVYATRNEGLVPFVYTIDHASDELVAPTGTRIPASYFETSGAYWVYPMLDEYGGSFLSEPLLCPLDDTSAPRAQRGADMLGVDVDGVWVPMIRSISRSFYYKPSALSQSPYTRTLADFRVARTSDVRYPSRKALLVEGRAFHADSQPDQALAVVASDLNARFRSASTDSVLPEVPVVNGHPTIEPTPFHHTRDGVLGIDW